MKRLLSVMVLASILEPRVALAALTPEQETELMREAETAALAGQFEKALPVYVRLFGETRKSVYLRNLGRCHQFLKHPEEAILSFRQYLAQNVDNVSPTERTEVEGFIVQMEALRKQQTSPITQTASTDPVPAVPTVVTSPAPKAPPADAWPWQQTTGLVAGGAGIVSIGVGAVLAVTGSSAASDAKERYTKNPTADVWTKAKADYDSAQSRNHVGAALVGVGAALAAGGAALYLLAPKASRKSAIALTARILPGSAGLGIAGRW
jgi:hypothetical protein